MSVYVSNLEDTVLTWDNTTRSYKKGNTQYVIMQRIIAKYRKPILFAFMAAPGRNPTLNEESLKTFHSAGKYKDIRFLYETEGWHGTKSVGLFLMDLTE
jgi:hypothetical protein